MNSKLASFADLIPGFLVGSFVATRFSTKQQAQGQTEREGRLESEVTKSEVLRNSAEHRAETLQQEIHGFERRAGWNSVTNAISALTFLVALGSGVFAWNQLSIDSEQAKFEQDQRALEMSLSLAEFWQSNFDAETRRRLERFIFWMNLRRPPESTSLKESLRFIANRKFINNVGTMERNPDIMHLLGLDLSLAQMPVDELVRQSKRALIYKEAYKFQTTLTKVLNTMEIIATVRSRIHSPRTERIIDDAYKTAIQSRTTLLEPYVQVFRRCNDRDAWRPLTNILERGVWDKHPALAEVSH